MPWADSANLIDKFEGGAIAVFIFRVRVILYERGTRRRK